MYIITKNCKSQASRTYTQARNSKSRTRLKRLVSQSGFLATMPVTLTAHFLTWLDAN